MCFLRVEDMQFMLVYVLLVAFHRKIIFIISKNGIFDVFTIIDQNSLRDFSLTRGQIKKRKLILESPDLLLEKLEKIKKFIFESQRTSYGHLKVWSKNHKFDPSRDRY
jgi:hypothetical protein